MFYHKFARLLLVICCFSHFAISQAQTNIGLTTGLGLPELFQLGVRLQTDKLQVGLGYGFLFSNDKENHTTSWAGDAFFHFAGHSKFSERQPFYFRLGLGAIRSENNYRKDNTLYLNPRFGREFRFSEKAGISLDLGLALKLYDRTVIKQPRPQSSWFNLGELDFDFPVLPSIGLAFVFEL